MMEHTEWRYHRGFIIVETRSPVLRRQHYAVWCGKECLGVFGDIIKAELFAEWAANGKPVSARIAETLTSAR
jgi:hypothetical protein